MNNNMNNNMNMLLLRAAHLLQQPECVFWHQQQKMVPLLLASWAEHDSKGTHIPTIHGTGAQTQCFKHKQTVHLGLWANQENLGLIPSLFIVSFDSCRRISAAAIIKNTFCAKA